MMIRKDYVKIAKAINNNTYDRDLEYISIGRDNLIDELCTIFKEDNSNFDNSGFKKACKGWK